MNGPTAAVQRPPSPQIPQFLNRRSPARTGVLALALAAAIFGVFSLVGVDPFVGPAKGLIGDGESTFHSPAVAAVSSPSRRGPSADSAAQADGGGAQVATRKRPATARPTVRQQPDVSAQDADTPRAPAAPRPDGDGDEIEGTNAAESAQGSVGPSAPPPLVDLPDPLPDPPPLPVEVPETSDVPELPTVPEPPELPEVPEVPELPALPQLPATPTIPLP